jgi:hypothetical protein
VDAKEFRESELASHLDELLSQVGLPNTIDLWVCTGGVPGALTLVPPESATDAQVWDQSSGGRQSQLDTICHFLSLSHNRTAADSDAHGAQGTSSAAPLNGR